MKAIALLALLLLAASASASISPWLALIAAWAGLIVVLLAAINAYRSRVEQTVTEQRIATIYERSGRLVLRRAAKETS